MTNGISEGAQEMSVATNIRKARENKGLSMKEAAALCGVSESSWLKYESSKVLPTAEPIRLMAKGLEVSTDEILMEPDERSVKAELRKIFRVVATLPEAKQLEIKRMIKAMVIVFGQEEREDK